MNTYFYAQTDSGMWTTEGLPAGKPGSGDGYWPVSAADNSPSFLQAVSAPTDYARLMEEMSYRVGHRVEKALGDKVGALGSRDNSDGNFNQRKTQSEMAVRIVESEYHDFLTNEVPLLSYLLARVVERHSMHYPEMWDLQGIFAEFEEQLTAHLATEQRSLFPLLREAEYRELNQSEKLGLEQVLCGLERNHAAFHEALDNVRAWTHDFAPPETACTVYRVVIHGMGELRRRMLLCVDAEKALYLRAERILGLRKEGQGSLLLGV